MPFSVFIPCKYLSADFVISNAKFFHFSRKATAVLIDGEATLKRVFLFADHIELRAENPAFPSIIRMAEAMNDVRIEGLAVGLCRKL